MTATAMHLYEATDALEIVRDWILEHDEELRANEGAFPDELAELLAKVEGDFATKSERVALFVRELLTTGKAIKIEEERLYARRKSMEHAAERLKRYLEMNMLIAEKMRIDGKLVTLRIQKNPASLHRDRELSQEELATWHAVDSTLVVFSPASYALNGAAVIAASRKTDEKGKVIGYDCPIEGLRVEQGASLRIV